MVRAGGAVFDLAGHGKEEVKVFCNAVQFTDVFICTQNTQIHNNKVALVKRAFVGEPLNCTDSPKFFYELVWLLCCNLLHIQYVQFLLRLKWKRWELTMNAPMGIHVGLQVYFVLQISYHRQVSTAVFD